MFFSSSTIRIVAISTLRQLQCETAALSDLALQVDAPAVRLHDVAYDRQTEPGGADVTGLRHLRKWFKNPLPLLGGDAGAGVDHRYEDTTVLRHGVDPHRAAGRRVA